MCCSCQAQKNWPALWSKRECYSQRQFMGTKVQCLLLFHLFLFPKAMYGFSFVYGQFYHQWFPCQCWCMEDDNIQNFATVGYYYEMILAMHAISRINFFSFNSWEENMESVSNKTSVFVWKRKLRMIHSKTTCSRGGRFELLTTYLNMMGADTFISCIFTAMDFLHMQWENLHYRKC